MSEMRDKLQRIGIGREATPGTAIAVLNPEVWLEGPVVCAACGRRWHAVRPLYALALECPDCHQYTGVADVVPGRKEGP